MNKALQGLLCLCFIYLCSYLNLQAQTLSPEAAKKQLAGKWLISREETMKVLNLCYECKDQRLLKDLEEMENAVIRYTAKGGTTAKFGTEKTKGTYTLETILDTTRICPGMKKFGTVLLMTTYTEYNDHGDRMKMVFMDQNTVCILDVGCPIAIVRSKKKK